LLGSFDLEAEQIFNNKNKFINLVKWWHIKHSIEYRV
jgi:hypothetical protein